MRLRHHHPLGLVCSGINAKKQWKMDNDPVATPLICKEALRLLA